VGTLAEIEWGLWVPSNLKGLASFDGEGWLAIGMAAPIRPELVTAVRPVKVVPVDAVVLEVETKSLLSAWHPRALRHDAALLDDRDMPVTAIRLEVIADAIERARPAEAPELPSDPSGGVATPGRPVSGGSVDAERRESALAAACESSPWLKPAAVARIMDAAFATLGGAR
jgi:hypothetical protein